MPSGYCDLDREIVFKEEYYGLVRRILGDLYSGEDFPRIRDRVHETWARGGYVATVGDRVTHDLLGIGIVPDIAFIDLREKRGEAPAIDRSFFNGYEYVVNRKGTINLGICRLILRRLGDRPWLFIVEGEEDLVGFPVVLALPIGSSFIYGAPGMGAVYVEVTEEIKGEAISIISRLLEEQ